MRESMLSELFALPFFKRRQFHVILLSTLLLLATASRNAVFASAVAVCTSSELSSAIADAKPGDTIEMCDRTWDNIVINFDVDGTNANPITLTTQSPGGVVLTGSSRITLAGKYAVIDGLVFEGRYTGTRREIIEFERSESNSCNNCRITNISMIDYNPVSQSDSTQWVVMHGKRNRVDHSHFKGKNNFGAVIHVKRDEDQTPNNHLIDHNLFEDRPEVGGAGNQNGDTLEIGAVGKYAGGESETTVEFNYLRNVDSDYEAITVKSSGNTLRYNVLDSSRGVLSLRQGHGNVVHSNYVFGRGKERTGGIRIRGRDHVISSNYISDINPTKISAYPALGINGGTNEIIDHGGEGTTPYYKFERANNVKVIHNTVVDSGVSVAFGNGNPLPPKNIDFMNNIVFRPNGTAIKNYGMGNNFSIESNLFFGGPVGLSEPGLIVMDPKLSPDSVGIQRPTSQSPAIAAASTAASTQMDMDGQARNLPADIGADEVIVNEPARGPIPICGVGPTTYRIDLPAACDSPISGVTTQPMPPSLLVVGQ